MSETICAVVVTYNRKQLLLECLESLLRQTHPLDVIYLIDNASTDGTPELLKEKGYISEILSPKDAPAEKDFAIGEVKIHYVRMDENTGGAGGFYEGLKRGYKKGYDWIWAMDDDAVLAPEALARVLETARRNNDKCFWSNCDDDVDFAGPTKEVDYWLFVGAFIHRSVIEKVGLPRKDFFIYHDDNEYAHRILKHGYKIIKVRDSIIRHADFLARESYEKTVFGREIWVPKLSDWKLYYYIRNGLLKYSYKDIDKYKMVYRTVQLGLKILLVNKVQFPIFLVAFFHGMIGRTGKTVNPCKI